PTLLLALIIVTALGGTLTNEVLAIGVALTPNFIRLARSLALTIREQDYILAPRALGSGQLRGMARHVFPHALSALVVVGALYIATAIRTEAALSFLGLGIPPPTPSWGNILSEGRQYIKCCPWITTFSGLAIMLAVLAFNLVGDSLRDLLDPRLKGEYTGPLRRIRPRWRVVFALVVVVTSVATPVSAFGVFLPVLATQFGWTRGAISTALSINLVLGGFAGFALAHVADRRG